MGWWEGSTGEDDDFCDGGVVDALGEDFGADHTRAACEYDFHRG